MGRKKQTIISTGGIIGDSIDKNVAFMMGQVPQMPIKGNIRKEGSTPTDGFPPHFGKSTTSPLKMYPSMANAQLAMSTCPRNKNFVFQVQESVAKTKKSLNDSFNYENSFCELDIEGHDSDVDLDKSIQVEELENTLEKICDPFELDICNNQGSQIQLEQNSSSDFSTFNSPIPFTKEKTQTVQKLRLEGFDRVNPILPNLPSISSLAPILPKSKTESFCSDDEFFFEKVVSNLENVEVLGDDIDDPDMELGREGLDHKYDICQRKKSKEEVLQKRVRPEQDVMSLLLKQGKKMVKDRFLFSNPNFADTQDGFYNLLIDRYRPQFFPTLDRPA